MEVPRRGGGAGRTREGDFQLLTVASASLPPCSVPRFLRFICGPLCQGPVRFLPPHLLTPRVVATLRETWSPANFDLGLSYLEESFAA